MENRVGTGKEAYFPLDRSTEHYWCAVWTRNLSVPQLSNQPWRQDVLLMYVICLVDCMQSYHQKRLTEMKNTLQSHRTIVHISQYLQSFLCTLKIETCLLSGILYVPWSLLWAPMFPNSLWHLLFCLYFPERLSSSKHQCHCSPGSNSRTRRCVYLLVLNRASIIGPSLQRRVHRKSNLGTRE